MVGMNLCKSRIGTVAIFATLFVAIQANGEKCVFDFDSGSGTLDFDLNCKDLKNTWVIKDSLKDKNSNTKKSVILDSEQVGCLITRSAIPLNSTTNVILKLGKESSDDINGIIVRLIPTTGSCDDKECVWIPESNAKTKTSEGFVLTHEFPVSGTKEYLIQVEVNKRKGKFELESISVTDLYGSKKCHRLAESSAAISGGVIEPLDKKPAFLMKYVGRAINETQGDASTALPPTPPPDAPTDAPPDNPPDSHETTTAKKAAAPGIIEISKNLMLTSVSVLTLNHLIN